MNTGLPYETVIFDVKTGKKIYASFCSNPGSQNRLYLDEIRRNSNLSPRKRRQRGIYKKTYLSNGTVQITDRIVFDDINSKSV